MLTDRIIGALTFRKGVYAEVEKDTSFTTTAWLLVSVVALLNQLGAKAPYPGAEELPEALGALPFAGGGIGNWLGAALVGTVFVVIGFAVGVSITDWVARTVFKADVSFDELVRTMGLAYVWQIVGLLGLLRVISPTLSCLAGPLGIAVALLGLYAQFVALKEALDLDSAQTIATVILVWIAHLFISLVVGGIVSGVLGFGAFAWNRIFG
jgi:hypothetical protein